MKWARQGAAIGKRLKISRCSKLDWLADVSTAVSVEPATGDRVLEHIIKSTKYV